MTTYIALIATQTRNDVFTGSLDDLTEIANCSRTTVYHVTAEQAAAPANEEETEPSHPEGEGWYSQLHDDDTPTHHDTQLAAVSAALDYDTQRFDLLSYATDAEKEQLRSYRFTGHRAVEFNRLLAEAVAE